MRRPARPSSGIRNSAGPLRCTRPSGSLRTRWRPASSQIAASICAALTPYRRARTLCRGSRQPGSWDSTARASRSARILAAGRAGSGSASAVARPVPTAGLGAARRPAPAALPSWRAELSSLSPSRAAASATLGTVLPLVSGTVTPGLRTRPRRLSRCRQRRGVRSRQWSGPCQTQRSNYLTDSSSARSWSAVPATSESGLLATLTPVAGKDTVWLTSVCLMFTFSGHTRRLAPAANGQDPSRGACCNALASRHIRRSGPQTGGITCEVFAFNGPLGASPSAR